MTVVLGIDPGLAATGYGVIEVVPNRFRHLGHGVITTDAGMPLGERLGKLYRELQEIIAEYHPSGAGVEALYFARNAKSVIPVAEARGIVLLALTQAGVTPGEYAPQDIKQAVVGQGRAEKEQVQEVVRLLLGLTDLPSPDHASDALAAAICHAHHAAFSEGVARAME
ncbi:MAG: crossover junction endodeoxyribonuclease RuvC [Spirochaetota bacterium]